MAKLTKKKSRNNADTGGGNVGSFLTHKGGPQSAVFAGLRDQGSTNEIEPLNVALVVPKKAGAQQRQTKSTSQSKPPQESQL